MQNYHSIDEPTDDARTVPVFGALTAGNVPADDSSSESDVPEEAPNDHGEGESGGVMGMTFNTITNVIGGGVLNIPSALYQSSLSVGVFLCVFSSVFATFAVYVLVKACDFHERYSMVDVWAFSLFPKTSRQKILDMVEQKRIQLADGILEDEAIDSFLLKEEHNAVWRERMITMMILIVFFLNYGCLVLYGVVIGESVPPVVKNFFHGDGIWVDKGTWLLIASVIFFLLSCVRKMNELRWSSLLGFLTILYVILMVIAKYFILKNHPEEMPSFDEDTDEVEYFQFNWGLANAMTTLSLAFCYHYNVPYFYKELHNRTPQKFMKTAVYAQPVIFLSYLATGIFGYLTFGAAVNNDHSGGNIVANYADDDTSVNIGRFGLFFHFCCVYPILAVSSRRALHHMLETYIFGPYRRSNRRLESRRRLINHQGGQSPHGSPRASRASVRYSRASVRASMRASTRLSQHHPSLKLRVLETPVIDEDPSRAILVGEAFVIVATSILCAWVAPGIKLVINITGSLFGIFLMFIAPGLIGLKMFAITRIDESGTYEKKHENAKYYACWVLVVSGVIFLVTSFYSIVA